jgi:hypothetical protein
VPASICIACSSVEGAWTLSEVRVVGLYQYIFFVFLPEQDDVSNVPVATSAETFAEVRIGQEVGESITEPFRVYRLCERYAAPADTTDRHDHGGKTR